LTRDVDGNVETVTVTGQSAWTISRDANGRITSLTDGAKDVTVLRDVEGRTSGIDVEDV
jgi:uncharacterized protein RhaS with RHS repeats